MTLNLLETDYFLITISVINISLKYNLECFYALKSDMVFY